MPNVKTDGVRIIATCTRSTSVNEVEARSTNSTLLVISQRTISHVRQNDYSKIDTIFWINFILYLRVRYSIELKHA